MRRGNRNDGIGAQRLMAGHPGFAQDIIGSRAERA